MNNPSNSLSRPEGLPEMMGGSKHRWRSALLKFALSLGLVAIFLSIVDTSTVLASLVAVDPATMAAAVGLCFSQTLFVGFRWHALGHRTGAFVGRWQAMRITFAAMFANQLMPTSIGGDLVRIGLLGRHGVPVGRGARTVVLDRTAGLLSLLTLMLVTGIVLGEQLPADWPVDFIKVLPVLAIVFIWAALFAGDRFADAVEARLKSAWLAQLLRDSSRLLRSGVTTVVILLLSYAVHSASATCIWILAQGSGVEISFMEILGFLPIVILVQLAPVSIAGWGVREGTVITLFALLGIDSAPALATSILWGAAIAGGAVLAGAIWFLTRSAGERLPEQSASSDQSEA
jgi:uncharacterized protein (TIRG00374 family)